MQVGGLYYKSCDFLLLSIPSAGFTIVLRCAPARPRWPGGHLRANLFLRWIFAYVVKFKGALFRSDFSHNDRVDSLLGLPSSGPN